MLCDVTCVGGYNDSYNAYLKENSTLEHIVEKYMSRISIPFECQQEVGYYGDDTLRWTGSDSMGTQSWHSNGDEFPLLRDQFEGCHRDEYSDDLWVCNPNDGLTEYEGTNVHCMLANNAGRIV